MSRGGAARKPPRSERGVREALARRAPLSAPPLTSLTQDAVDAVLGFLLAVILLLVRFVLLLLLPELDSEHSANRTH